MDGFLRVVWAHKVAFLATFFVVFTLSYVTLMALDLLPEPPAEESYTEETNLMQAQKPGEGDRLERELSSVVEPVLESQAVVVSEEVRRDESTETSVTPMGVPVTADAVLPTQISIDKIGKTIPVLNPSSRTIADLDAALLEGVVRHPDSATLSQEGNVFVLGHSSYLPNVFNRNFQAFNGIQNLEWGDVIQVYSADHIYEYRVERVYRARAQDVTVPIAGTGNMLTLATCNSFGSVDDRYIVEARQKSVRSL